MLTSPPESLARACSRLWAAAAVLLLAALQTACVEGVNVATPFQGRMARLPIQAHFAGSVSHSAPINRIRITLTVEPAGETVGPFVFNVADDDEWSLPVQFPLAAPSEVMVLAELLSVTNGVERTEFSGRMGPIKVTPGSSNTNLPSMAIYPGSPADLDITLVRIGGAASVNEGGTLQLDAAIDGGAATSRALWASLTPTLATVDANGLVRALLPGSARIVAQAGPRADTLTLQIGRRMERVEVTPGANTATSVGAEVNFAGRVLDPRGAEFTGVAINWSVADPSIAQHIGNGRFRARSRGRTQVTATVDGAGTLVATAELIVDQRVARVEVTPANTSLPALGATATLAAAVTDAGGSPIPGVAVQWSVSNPTAASVDQNGVVTARANGQSNVIAQVDGIRGEAALLVQQRVTTIEVTPGAATFTSVGSSQTFTAVPRDERGNPVAGSAFGWRSNNPSVAQVNASGVVVAVARGQTSIAAELPGAIGSAMVTVAPQPSRITFSTNRVVLPGPGATYQLTGTPRDESGSPIPGATIRWISLTPQIATISATGLVTAVSTGLGQVGAVVNGFEGLTFGVPVEVQGNPPVQTNATITGSVINAFSGAAIAGAALEARSGSQVVGRTITNANGAFALAVSAGNLTVTVTANGFVPSSRDVVISAGQTATQNFAVVPQIGSAGAYRIILTWGSTPSDLDSHMNVSAFGTSRHVYYGSQGSLTSVPYVALDLDDVSGFGPETITIQQFDPSGTYSYSVNNYSREAPISASGAKVEIYQGNTKIGEATVPSGSGTTWNVFRIVNGQLQMVNVISSTVSFTGARPILQRKGLNIDQVIR